MSETDQEAPVGNGVVGDQAAAADGRASAALAATATVTPGIDPVTLRLEALRLAHDADAEPEDVRDRADTYYDWLKG